MSSSSNSAAATVRRQPGSGRRPLSELLHNELSGGVVLAAATVVALAWANASYGTYESLWEIKLGPSALHLDLSLHHWVNDGLMALFFFVVGLEIKRELVVGELSKLRDAAMPVIAAAGGMAVPAILYTVFNRGGVGEAGWGIPMATDIAFVLGALALLGSRAPAGLRLFLLAVAIVDDLGAIAVIAIFYSKGMAPLYLLLSVGLIAGIVVMQRVGVSRPAAYVLPAVLLWYCVHESGVHATVAGVLVGLLTPARPILGRPVLDDLQHRLHPFTSLLVVPLFALANAGVVVRSDTLADLGSSTVALGIAAGLIVGKTVGITAATLLALRLGLGRLPAGVARIHLIGGAALAGIGFTVALFIAELSFGGTPQLAEAKLAILMASVLAGTVGATILVRANRSASRSEQLVHAVLDEMAHHGASARQDEARQDEARDDRVEVVRSGH